MGQAGRPPSDGWLRPRDAGRALRRPESSDPTTPTPRAQPDQVSETIAALRAASAAFARVESSGEQVRRRIERIATERQFAKHEFDDDAEFAYDDDEYVSDAEFAYGDDEKPTMLIEVPPLRPRNSSAESVRFARSELRQRKRRRRLAAISLVAAIGLCGVVVATQAVGTESSPKVSPGAKLASETNFATSTSTAADTPVSATQVDTPTTSPSKGKKKTAPTTVPLPPTTTPETVPVTSPSKPHTTLPLPCIPLVNC